MFLCIALVLAIVETRSVEWQIVWPFSGAACYVVLRPFHAIDLNLQGVLARAKAAPLQGGGSVDTLGRKALSRTRTSTIEAHRLSIPLIANSISSINGRAGTHTRIRHDEFVAL